MRPPALGAPNVAHGPAPAHGAVDLEADAEDHIRQGQAGPSASLRRLGHDVAELPKQGDEVILLVHLCHVVGGPVLALGGHPHGLGLDGGAVGSFLALDGELDRIDVLAPVLALLEVRAGAERVAIVHAHDVRAVARLRWDLVAKAVLLDGHDGGDSHSPLLASGVPVVGVVWPQGCKERYFSSHIDNSNHSTPIIAYIVSIPQGPRV